MAEKFPINPNVYLILVGIAIFIIGIKNPFLGIIGALLAIGGGLIGGAFLCSGYYGLKHTQFLKDKKLEEEVKLIMGKQLEQNLINEKIVTELANEEELTPSLRKFYEGRKERIKKRIKK